MNASPDRSRFSTRDAIDLLAATFGLPNEPWMQDWEIQVADPSRIDDFLAVYESESLSEDCRFSLMQILLQCFEDLPHRPESDPRWPRLIRCLRMDSGIHDSTIEYWTGIESEKLGDAWRVSKPLRNIFRVSPVSGIDATSDLCQPNRGTNNQ